MFCLTNTDTLEGIASVASKVDYLIYGFVAGTPTRLASGQLSDSSAILYTATAATHVISVSFVNTHTSVVSIDFYLDPLNAGTPRRAISKTLVLQAGYSLYFDGQRCMMIDTSGGIVSGGNVSDAVYGSNWDGVTSVSPSKNAVYDQMQLKLTGSYASAAEINAGTEAAKAIAPDQLKLSSPTVVALTASAGNITATHGDFVVGTAGHGIDFSADSSAAGMTSELLDDYEEGTWTPVIHFSSVQPTTVSGTGTYTKVGNVVTARWNASVTTIGSASGSADITGLPFACASGGYSPPSMYLDKVKFANAPMGFVNSLGTNILLYEATEAGIVTSLGNSDFENGSQIIGCLTYMV